MKQKDSAGLAGKIQELAAEIFPEVVDLRRDIHLHPSSNESQYLVPFFGSTSN